MLSFLYVYSHHSILECYNLFSGVELSMRSFCVITVLTCAKNGFEIKIGLAIGFEETLTQLHVQACRT